ncbi:LysR family transcriptional regulator [Paraburkholderia sp. SIMBA_050]
MHLDHVMQAHSPRPVSRQLDLNLLELFEVVYRTRNLTLAGSCLGLTQPAVSRGLARLREMYGDALFVRQQRGVAPTPFADSLAVQVAQALEIVRSTIRRPSFAPGLEARVFRVAMSDIGERLFLPRLMTCLAQHAPRVVVDVVSPAQGELRDGLASGQIDLAMGFLGDLSKQMHQRRLFTERFIYVARCDHPLISPPLRREQLCELSHVVAGPTGMLHAASVEKVLSNPRVRASVALRVHSFLCVAPVVASTDLVAAVPSNLAATVAEHMRLQILEPPVRFPTFDVALTWHQRFHRDPGNEWLREVFVSLFGTSAFSAGANV